MRVEAWASDARAIVAIDPENIVNRNFAFDPRFQVDLHNLATAGPDGRPLLVDVRGDASPYIQGGMLRTSSWQTTGSGARVRVLPDPTAPAGTTLHGRITVAQSTGYTSPNWQARLTRQDGTVLGGTVQRVGPGTLEFSGVVGPGSDTYVEVTNTNDQAFEVTGLYVGTKTRTGVFSGSDPNTATARYSWAGTAGRSVSLETLTAEHETITVHRVHDGGRLVPIRGYQHAPAVGASISDNEVPLRESVFYQVTTGSGQRYFSNMVVVQPLPPVFTDPGTWPVVSDPVTGKHARVILVSWDTITYRTEKQRVRVHGRRSPVVISDVEAAGEATIVIETRSRADREKLDGLLAAGGTLLLRAPCPDIEDAYLDVDNRAVTRVLKTGLSERREHSLTAVLIDPPDMDLRGRGDTLGDLAAATFTLQDIAERWATLGAVASADLIAGGPR